MRKIPKFPNSSTVAILIDFAFFSSAQFFSYSPVQKSPFVVFHSCNQKNKNKNKNK